MRGMLLVARRDLAGYLNSYWGYAVIAGVLALDGILFNAFAVSDRPRYSGEVLADFFEYTCGVVVVAAILLSMRLLAEEKQTGTIALLDSSPLAPWQIVGGKYLSVMGVLTILIALTFYMPVLVFVNGKVSYGHLFAGYSGLLLAAGAAAAVGTFASTLTRYQIVAGIIATAIIVFFYVTFVVAKISDPPLKDVFAYTTFYIRHFRQGFKVGAINSESVIYYLSLVFVFLMMATRLMTVRRWR